MVRTSASSSPARKPPPSAIVTACCASRSSGRSTGKTAFDRACPVRVARPRPPRQFERVRGHARNAADHAGTMARAPGALQQPRDALRAADLQTRSTGEKSTPRSRLDVHDDAAQRALAQAVLDPIAKFAFERSMVDRDESRPIRPRIENCLIPDFALRSRIGENERCGAFFDGRDHLIEHVHAEVAGPGKVIHALRHERIDDSTFSAPPRGQRGPLKPFRRAALPRLRRDFRGLPRDPRYEDQDSTCADGPVPTL